MKIINFKTIDSTNTYALKNFDVLENFTIISADAQTAGKGRFDRVWVSDDFENIYLSFVLKPLKKEFLANLTQYLCVVTSVVLEKYGVEPKIKWPNDVLVNEKKICGILCESKMKNNHIQGVVLGIGINLNMPENFTKKIDKPVTSLNLETGTKIDKDEFLTELVNEFSKDYEKIIGEGFSSFKEEYLKRVDFLGKTVFIQQRDNSPKEKFTALKLDDFGNLIVKDENNEEKTVFSGDLIL